MRLLFRSRAAIQAENLFLRRQLALYRERKTRRSRPTPAIKFALVALSRFFPWASALAIVKPDTFVRWHRAGFRLLWRLKSRRAGRPPRPKNLRALVVPILAPTTICACCGMPAQRPHMTAADCIASLREQNCRLEIKLKSRDRNYFL